MKILATRLFIDGARGRARERTREPSPGASADLLVQVRRLLAGDAAGPSAHRAASLKDGRYLGYRRDPQQLSLWFCCRPDPPDPPDALPPLASLSRAELLDCGVDEPLVSRAQRATRITEIDALGLSAATAEQLKFRFLQIRHGLSCDASELSRQARDVTHLEDFLRGRITDLMLRLDPEQTSIVHLPQGGPIAIRGVAGSGKTAVVLQRIARMLRQGDLLAAPRVLLLVFANSLATAARELLSTLQVRPEQVEITTFHRWCTSYLRPAERVVDTPARHRLLHAAVETVRTRARESALWAYPLVFWEEEVHRVKGRAISAQEGYLRMARHGAGRPLDAKLRPLVWQVIDEYQRGLEREGAIDWDDLALLALRRLEADRDTRPRYRCVFVDEAQDLTPVALRLASELTEGGEVLVAYDLAQSIYEKGFRWRDTGIALHGSRSFVLRTNYRNTREILELAKPLLDRMRNGTEVEEADPIDPVDLPSRRGSAPRMLRSAPGQEIPLLVRDIRQRIARDLVPPQNIAVLCYPNAMRDRVYQTLRGAGVECQRHDRESSLRLGDASVKVLPIKSAKGLEFPAVYIVASGRLFRPPKAMQEPEERQAWLAEMHRVFYMAMTRAMASLTLVFSEGDPPSFFRIPGSASRD